MGCGLSHGQLLAQVGHMGYQRLDGQGGHHGLHLLAGDGGGSTSTATGLGCGRSCSMSSSCSKWASGTVPSWLSFKVSLGPIILFGTGLCTYLATAHCLVWDCLVIVVLQELLGLGLRPP